MKAGIYDNSTLNSSDEDLSVSQLHFSVLQRASSKAVFFFFIFLFSETKSSFNGPSVLPAEASVFMSSLNTKQTKKRRQRASSVSTIKNSRVIDRYRNLCHVALSLHGQLTFSSAFCVVVISMKNTYSAFRNRRNERIVDRGRLLCICYNVTTNVRLIWDLSIINRSFETGAQTEWSHWRISIQLTRILWLIRLMFW